MSGYLPDREESVKGDALPGEDNDWDDVDDDDDNDHDDEGMYEYGDAESEIGALGQALISAILERAPPEDVRKLLEEDEAPVWYQDEDGWSALHAAASVEDAELVKRLLQLGAPWNSGEKAFFFALHRHPSHLLMSKAVAAAASVASASGQHREHGWRRCAFSERRRELPRHP
jgi:ankyrin repeat protein